eukprot:gene16161-17784_t
MTDSSSVAGLPIVLPILMSLLFSIHLATELAMVHPPCGFFAFYAQTELPFPVEIWPNIWMRKERKIVAQHDCVLSLSHIVIESRVIIAQLCRNSLYSPENGEISELLEVESGSGRFAARFKCNPGHRMIGQLEITCDETGKWTSRVPWCKSLCNFFTCKDGKKCIIDQASASTRCVCKDIYECPFQYKPVCGSDHVTYANKCILGMTACQKKKTISRLSNNACPKGIFKDDICSECPRTRICPALYNSDYAFLGKLAKLNETKEGIYLEFQIIEIYKGVENENGNKKIILFKKKEQHYCNCTPFIPSGKSYIFGKLGKGPSNEDVMAFNERTFVEKFYSHKQMGLCWLY